MYEKEPFVPYGKYNQHKFSFDSVDSYIPSSKFNFPYSSSDKSQFSYGSTENDVTPNAPQFSYSLTPSYAPPSAPQVAYHLAETYENPIRPQVSYGSTEFYPSTTSKPQVLYGLTGTYSTTNKPEFSFGSTESYATTSKPQFVYSSPESYSSTSQPQYSYSSTETYATGKPKFSVGLSDFYSSTGKPQYSYGASESYSTTSKPQYHYGEADSYIISNQPSKSISFDYNSYKPVYSRFVGPLGVLHHQQHDSEEGSQYRVGTLLHQQNNFQSIPVNNNYDSHKNDVQYPPIKDFETYSTTPRPLNKITPAGLYSASYSSSNVYSNLSPASYVNNESKNSYSILGGVNSYNSHKVYEQYQPSYNFETYSTTQKPLIRFPEVPAYSQSNTYVKPTSKPFESYLYESSHSSLNKEYESQYSTTGSPYIPSSPSNIKFNDYHISSTEKKPALYDTSLYQGQFKSQFNFEDYLSRISSQQYSSTTPIVDYTPSIYGNSFGQSSSVYSSTTAKPTVIYYSSPSPTLSSNKESYDVPLYSSSPKVKAYTESTPSYSSSFSYPVTTANPIDYQLKHEESISSTYAPLKYSSTVTPSAYSSTFKPTVNYYTPSSTVAYDDSAFVEELISKLSKTPISTIYSSSTTKPPVYAYYPSQQTKDYVPNDSFDIDEYVAKLSESIENSTPKPLYSSTSYKPSYSLNDHSAQPLPTSSYFSSTSIPKTSEQQSYSALPVQSTTCKPEAALKISQPSVQYIPSLESVFSVRPPVSYTQRPEPLSGYSSTASDLINYYHNLHSSLDSAYRSPLPRYYASPVGNSLYTENYTLPRDYEKDAVHNLHTQFPAYPLKPIIVEPVSPELNAEFERYYTAGVRQNVKSEENGKVLLAGDTNSLLVGKLGAQCDCAKKKKPTVVTSTTRTVIEHDDDDDDDEKTVSVKEVETKTKVVLEELKKPSNKKLCTRPGLFRDPKQCNKFYSCNWDKWTQKYELSEFKCPIHLAFDENLSACNWPSKGPACSHDTLINYAN